MESVLRENRRRAESFGKEAERYERARPSYPESMVDDLLASKPSRVLDVGCGTGKVARLFLARGCEVLGVEPDSRMASVARSLGIQVEVSTFEAWTPPHRMFDLVVCGQAWHWVDPSVGLRKAAAILPPGKWLAIFWNRGRFDPATAAAIDQAYLRFAPALATESGPLGNTPTDPARDIDAIAATHLFGPCQLRTYNWAQQYSRDQWLDQLATHSNHIALESEQLATLLDAVGSAIDRRGGSITVDYETQLISAQRIESRTTTRS
jgi:SAM-dependent methyltransferase